MSKFLTVLVGLFLSVSSAFAVDTSGCTPLTQKNQSVKTVSGKALVVQAFQAKPGCWNANQSQVQINYYWLQDSFSAENVHAHFWVRINGEETNLDGQVSCHLNSGWSLGADTSGHGDFLCSAVANVGVKADSVTVEVAPELQGQWDTAGYGQNYTFKF